jgi:hypothetical protein
MRKKIKIKIKGRRMNSIKLENWENGKMVNCINKKIEKIGKKK